MKEAIRQQLLEHYARDIEGLNAEELIAEALASIEAMFSYMDEDDVFKRSRPYAVSYLALCAAQELLSIEVESTKTTDRGAKMDLKDCDFDYIEEATEI